MVTVDGCGSLEETMIMGAVGKNDIDTIYRPYSYMNNSSMPTKSIFREELPPKTFHLGRQKKKWVNGRMENVEPWKS